MGPRDAKQTFVLVADLYESLPHFPGDTKTQHVCYKRKHNSITEQKPPPFAAIFRVSERRFIAYKKYHEMDLTLSSLPQK